MALCGLCIALAGVGCATPPTAITTNPSGAFVAVNGVGAGASPVNYTFDFNKQPVYEVKATKTGYFDSDITLRPDSAGISNGVLTMALPRDEAYEQTTTTEATNRWLKVEVAGKMTQADAWQKIVDSVTGRYSSIEQMDNASGYLRSVAIARAFKHPVNGEYTIRTQFLGAVSSRDPLVYKMEILAQQSTANGNWVPYDRVFKEDAQLLEEMQARLGTK
ncbi:MAG TPA: hypothetical protein VLI90_10130 [Tepidisphaeraceae bacterium]|nr:hypothetical protein [Tepidisphaeraceae bacterium]